MAIQYINTGSGANAGNGDSLRSAFIKVNNNFTYLSTASFGVVGNGYTGSQGLTGYTGSAGANGSQGAIGYTGSAGTLITDFIFTGDAGQFPFYGTTGRVLSPNTLLFANTVTSTLNIGNRNHDGNVHIIRNSYSSFLQSGFLFEQHHETADAVNFNLYRTRGNNLAPTTVQNGDDIADISFVGHDGTIPLSVGGITVTVDGPVSTGTVTAKLLFRMRTSSGSIEDGAELTSNGTWKINRLSNLTTTTSSIVVSTNLIPASDLTYDLGSTSSQWRSLHVGTSTIYLGGTALSVSGGNLTVDGVAVNNENLEIDGGYASAEFTTADLEVDGGGA